VTDLRALVRRGQPRWPWLRIPATRSSDGRGCRRCGLGSTPSRSVLGPSAICSWAVRAVGNVGCRVGRAGRSLTPSTDAEASRSTLPHFASPSSLQAIAGHAVARERGSVKSREAVSAALGVVLHAEDFRRHVTEKQSEKFFRGCRECSAASPTPFCLPPFELRESERSSRRRPSICASEAQA
jgi:hypothetical protein